MSDRKKTYDVFLTSTTNATGLVVKVEAILIAAGLKVFSPLRVPAGANMWERLREELGASLSVVAVLGEYTHLPPSLAIEIGAALAWNKPTYALLENLAELEPGVLPADVQVLDLPHIDQVVQDVHEISQPLTAEQKQLLAEVYTDVNVPTDQLPRSPDALSRFTDRFNKATHRRWSSERLLREVLVMRKSGRLPKLRRNSASNDHRIPA
ncbi:MAG TPA: hypothetical protein VM008_16385 [Phycisphaerae bacterium]|nr:hypothetical protein [Phycisphaerae bacterium]